MKNRNIHYRRTIPALLIAPLRLFQLKTTILPLRTSTNRSPLRHGVLLIALALVCFAFSPVAQALSEGNLGNGNTAEGSGALQSLTTGIHNTADGHQTLLLNTTGNFNTATGSQALKNNTGDLNTADGFHALLSNTTGSLNTATGWKALVRNTTGFSNTSDGCEALLSNTTGFDNIAIGESALVRNTTGSHNIAIGGQANPGPGAPGGGGNLTTGDNNIDIGNEGVAAEANTIRIGEQGTQLATFIAGISGATVASGVTVVVGTDGHLGTIVSSQRFKDEIKPMNKASEAILALKPVTFRYKHELDPKGIPQFGLVAEQVEKVNPDLVARDAQGKVYTVRYEAVNAMLLNEFLKEHHTVQELKSTAVKQEATIAKQQKQIEALTTGLQKVSDQLELSKPALRTVVNNQ